MGIHGAHRLGRFDTSVAAISIVVSATVLVTLGTLLWVPDWAGLSQSIDTAEMAYAVGLSLGTGLLATALVMLVAIPTGYAFSRFSFPGYRIARTVIYLPIALPEIVLGLCLLLLLGDSAPGRLLEAIGLDFVFTKKGIVAAQFFTALPYAVRVIKTSFDGVDSEMELVSRTLGYSQLRTFLAVSLPLARGGLKAAAAIALARCVGAFGSVLVLAGGTHMQTETLPIALYLNLSYGNLDMAIISGLLLVLISFVGILAIEAGEPARKPV